MRLARAHQIRVALLGVALACALAPVQSAGARAQPGSGVLSPRLAELARPAVRSASPRRQARMLEMAAAGPGSLVREGGRVLVEVRVEGGVLARLAHLRAAGGRILAANRGLQTATVSIAPAALHELAAVAGVEEVHETRAPLIYGGGLTAAVGAQCEGGSVISEGVAQLHADEARGRYGVNGAGVTVGVLSDSYDQASESADEGGPIATHAAEDVASGDLPGAANPCASERTPVNVISDDFRGVEEVPATDEGRAMLQIVHDVAPGASLAFGTAFDGESAFAQNITKLARPLAQRGAGAQVIVDDVAYFEEPFFQDGPVAAAINRVTEEGVSYFTAAGNDNLFDGEGNEIASWEAPSFRDSSTCPATLLAQSGFGAGHCMDFDPGPETDDTFGITVSPKETLTVDLQWAEPWNGVQTDLDAYLLGGGGELLASETSDNVSETRRPVEVLQWENPGNTSREVELAINRCIEACNPAASTSTLPRLKLALLENGAGVTGTEYPLSSGGDTVGPTIFGHAGAASAVSVGAVPFDDSTQPEPYSSRGPVTHYFGPVSGNSPAPELGSPEVLAKPDLVATDCGATTFFAFFSANAWRFCGTSAAAPHAAGVAALELQVDPSASPAEVREAQTATASPVGAFAPTAVGAGLLDADHAVADLLPPSLITFTEHPASRTSNSTPTFGFEATPPATGFSCALDGGPAQPCSSPFTVPDALKDGLHIFEVNALSGSTVLDTASYSFTVDTTPPTISFAGQATVVSENTPRLIFSANEPAAFTCALDGGAPQSCSSPFTVPQALTDGAHTLRLTATDQAGNSREAQLAFVVDTTPPTVAFSVQPRAETNDVRPTFAFSASEPASFSCSLDQRVPQPCGSPFTVPDALADGTHSLEVTATDRAGNSGHATASFVLDTVAPQTFIAHGPRRKVRTRLARVTLALRFRSNEEGATFLCRIDRGPLRPCPGVLWRRFAPGAHVVRVKAVDPAGNVDPTAAVYRWRVRRLAPSG